VFFILYGRFHPDDFKKKKEKYFYIKTMLQHSGTKHFRERGLLSFQQPKQKRTMVQMTSPHVSGNKHRRGNTTTQSTPRKSNRTTMAASTRYDPQLQRLRDISTTIGGEYRTRLIAHLRDERKRFKNVYISSIHAPNRTSAGYMS